MVLILLLLYMYRKLIFLTNNEKFFYYFYFLVFTRIIRDLVEGYTVIYVVYLLEPPHTFCFSCESITVCSIAYYIPLSVAYTLWIYFTTTALRSSYLNKHFN